MPGIEPNGFSNLVHLHFQGKGGGRYPKATHGTARLSIGVNAVGIDMHIGNVVWAGHIGGMFGNSVGGMPVIGARISIAGDLASNDPAVW